MNNINEEIKKNNIELVKGLSPQNVFNYFAEIASIPRPSGHMTEILEYLISFAKKNNLSYETDEFNNIIMTKKTLNATKSTITLQSHMDMVCVKNADCKKNLYEEGINLILDNEYLRGDGTSLGADDGIGMAIIMAILSSEGTFDCDVVGIFTSDEEVGLVGANNIDLSKYSDIKYLINLDNEELGIIDVGCAGGTHIEYGKKYDLVGYDINELEDKVVEIKLSNCIGGHSGMEITKNRANAIVLLMKFLYVLYFSQKFGIVSLNGGEFDNAIPKECSATLIFDKKVDATVIKEFLDGVKKTVIQVYPNETAITLSYDIKKCSKNISALSFDDTNEFLELLKSLPDGLVSTFDDFKDKAKTSLNLGIIKCDEGFLRFTYLIRSNVDFEKTCLDKLIYEKALKTGFHILKESSYPAWEYKKSEFLDFVTKTYEELFSISPKIEITHGGLECGILLEKLKGVNAIAVGPTILDVHTMSEKLEVPTVEKIYRYVCEIIRK